MKNKLLDFIKGFLLGLDATIPGFSIGTLAVFLNIYERLINDISDLNKHLWTIIKKDFILALGFVIGFVISVLGIKYLLTNFPFETVMFFVGLVIASIPITFKSEIKEKLKIRDFIAFFTSVVILIGITLLNAGEAKEVALSPVFLIMMFIVAVIDAGAMIIPGVSGNLVVMALGYYDAIIDTLNSLLHISTAMNEGKLTTYLVTALVLVLGIILGIVLVAKLIKFLMGKWRITVYSAIMGLLASSPFSIIYLTVTNSNYSSQIDYSSPWLYIVSAITLLLGIVFAVLMNKFAAKKEENKESTED